MAGPNLYQNSETAKDQQKVIFAGMNSWAIKKCAARLARAQKFQQIQEDMYVCRYVWNIHEKQHMVI